MRRVSVLVSLLAVAAWHLRRTSIELWTDDGERRFYMPGLKLADPELVNDVDALVREAV
jgi:hypothetical protein